MIVDKVYEHIEKTKKTFGKPSGNWASTCGNPCERALVYARTHFDERLLPSTSSQLMFREGHSHEHEVLKLLSEAGFEVVEQQRPFRWEKVNVSGKIDAKVKIGSELVPIEIKSMNGYDFDKIKTLEDLKNSPKSWHRQYPAQIMLYMLMDGCDMGILIFKNRQNGALKEIVVNLDFEYAENILKKLERVNEHVRLSTLPDRISDRGNCRMCDFRHICLPDEESEAINLIDNKDLEVILERREEIRKEAKEYQNLNEKLKEVWKTLQPGEHLVGRKYSVKISEVPVKFYNVPPEIKESYVEKRMQIKSIITPIMGDSDGD